MTKEHQYQNGQSVRMAATLLLCAILALVTATGFSLAAVVGFLDGYLAASTALAESPEQRLMVIGAASSTAGSIHDWDRLSAADGPSQPSLASSQPMPANPEDSGNAIAGSAAVSSIGSDRELVQSTVAVLVEPTPAALRLQEESRSYRDLFVAVAADYGLDWRLLAALAYRESGLDPFAVGQDQDMGLMQIIPETWSAYAPGARAADPFMAEENARVAAAYLVYLHDFLRTQGVADLRWTVLAYNWGPHNVATLLASDQEWEAVPLLQRRYVADILGAAYGVDTNFAVYLEYLIYAQ